MSSQLSENEQTEVKQRLVHYMHHHCPANYESGDIYEDNDFIKLPMNSKAVVNATKSYQEMFKDDLDVLTSREYMFDGLKRESNPDGEAGRNTYELLHAPRCGMPDFKDLTIDDDSAQEGNWPDSCRNEIFIARDFISLPGVDQERTDFAFRTARDNWNEALELTIVLVPVHHTPLRGIIRLAVLAGSTLARQFLAISNCDYTSRGEMDSDRSWAMSGLPEAVITHEWGHLLGFEHVPDGVSTMHPSIHSAARNRNGKPVEGDLREARRKGYKIRESYNEVASGSFRVLDFDSGIKVGDFSFQSPLTGGNAANRRLKIDHRDFLEIQSNTGKVSKFTLQPEIEFH